MKNRIKTKNIDIRRNYCAGNAVRSAVAVLLATILLCAASFTAVGAMEKHGWFFKSRSDNTQPEILGGNTMPDKYGSLYLGAPDEKVVYLTFDAGYENGNVAKTLDILKAHSAPGAFFILPEIPRRYPELVARMRDEGHSVCNHSYTHRDMADVTDYNVFLTELIKAEEACHTFAETEMRKYFRPPEGSFTEQTLQFCVKAGYTPVFWSFAYADWDNGSQMSHEKAYEKIMSNVHNGMVMLLHPTSATNAAILDRVLTSLEEQGYRFGTLDELYLYARMRAVPGASELDPYCEKGIVYVNNPIHGKQLALTFDDGPHPTLTDEVLDILEEYEIKATFFVIGKNVSLHPEQVSRAIDDGHEIGNHGFSHTFLTKNNLDSFIADAESLDNIMKTQFGYAPALFRPAGGRFSGEAIERINSLGYKYVLYSWWVDARDWTDVSARSIVKTVKDNVRGGDVILLHDYKTGYSATPDALRELIPYYLERGYEFVTVSELFSS